jgi:hypothetical protein
MGLLSTAAVIAIIAIVVAAAVLFAFTKVPNTKLTLVQAKSLVISDIEAQNPTANVTFLPGASNSTLPNSFYIPLSVVYNGSKPCPTVMIEAFNYPAGGLRPINDTQASAFDSGNCNIYVQGSLPPYAPLFIASSYASGNSLIRSYVNRFGYVNTFVTASRGDSAIVGNQTNVWLVTYKAVNANYSLYAILNPSGTVTQAYNSSS